MDISLLVTPSLCLVHPLGEERRGAGGQFSLLVLVMVLALVLVLVLVLVMVMTAVHIGGKTLEGAMASDEACREARRRAASAAWEGGR